MFIYLFIRIVQYTLYVLYWQLSHDDNIVYIEKEQIYRCKFDDN